MDELLITGRVHTFDPGLPLADAVAVRAGRIVAVGTVADCRAAVSARFQPVAGAAVLPGFTDAHVHPLFGGLDLVGCDLHGADDAAGYLALIDAHARAQPRASWISGGGWTLPAFPGGLPTAAQLDTVTGDRPAYLVNTDRHGAWVNSAALRAAGIDAATPDPPDGRIERGPGGAPTGMLHEGAASLVARAMPAPSPALLRRALLAAQQHLHARGITGWQDAIVGPYLGYPDPLPVYRDLASRGELTGTVELALWWDRTRGADQVPDLSARRREIADLVADLGGPRHGPRMRAGTVKIMVDGIVESCSAAVHTPYAAPAGHGTGTLFVGGDDLVTAVGAVDLAGFAAHLHAIGDRAVTQALDAIGAARTARAAGLAGVRPAGAPGPAHHIAHLQLVAPSDVARFAALGVTANLQMYWAADDLQVRTLCRPLLGDDRVDAQYPFADLHRAGAALAAGSDWPVTTASVLAQVQVALTRRPVDEPDIAPLGPGQALDLHTALAACTVGGAALHGRDAAIRPGAAADLTVLAADPYTEPTDRLAAVPVLATVAAGRVVYEA